MTKSEQVIESAYFKARWIDTISEFLNNSEPTMDELVESMKQLLKELERLPSLEVSYE